MFLSFYCVKMTYVGTCINYSFTLIYVPQHFSFEFSVWVHVDFVGHLRRSGLKSKKPDDRCTSTYFQLFYALMQWYCFTICIKRIIIILIDCVRWVTKNVNLNKKLFKNPNLYVEINKKKPILFGVTQKTINFRERVHAAANSIITIDRNHFHFRCTLNLKKTIENFSSFEYSKLY